MRSWPGLLGTPLLALADQSVAYAFVPYSCSHQQSVVLHAVHAVFLVAILACALHVWPRARPVIGHLRNDEGATVQRGDLMAILALSMAIFSAAIVVAMWIPQFLLAPCFA
jgi:hypothetical protein